MRSVTFFFFSFFIIDGFSQRLPDVIPYRIGNLWGGVDSTKKIIVPVKYESVYVCDDSAALVIVQKNKKQGAYNFKGKLTVPLIYDEIECDKGWKYLFVRKNGKYGFLDLKGKIIVPTIYDQIDWDPSLDSVNVRRNYLWGLLKVSTGKEIIPCATRQEPDEMFGYYEFIRKNKHGLRTRAGRVIIPAAYQYFNFDDYPVIYASRQKEIFPCAVYDTSGKLIVKKLKTGQLEDYTDSLALVEVKEGYELVSVSGKILLKENYKGNYVDMSYWGSKYFLIADQSGLQGVINIHKKEIVKPAYGGISFYFLKWGTVFFVSDTSGKKNWIIDSLGKTILTLDSGIYSYELYDHFFIVRNKDKVRVGVMDYKGKMIIPFDYEDIHYDGSENIFMYREWNKWGLMDVTGKKITDAKYYSISQFQNGNAFVQTKTTPHNDNLIDKTGNLILPANKYDSLLTYYEYYEVNLHGNYFHPENWSYKPVIYCMSHSGEGLLSPSGKIIIPDTFSAIVPYEKKLYKVYLRNKTVYSDINGTHEISPYAVYDSTGNRLSDFYDEIIFDAVNPDKVVSLIKNGKLGYANEQFKWIIPAEYYSGAVIYHEKRHGGRVKYESRHYILEYDYYEYYMQQTKDGLLDVYTESGTKREGLSGKASHLQSIDDKKLLYIFSGTTSFYEINSNKKMSGVNSWDGIMDSTGKIIIPQVYRNFVIGAPEPGYIGATDTLGHSRYFDFTGKELHTFSDSVSVYGTHTPGVFIMQKGKKYGLVSSEDGHVIVPAIYDHLYQPNKNRYFIFSIDKKWGIMNAKGNIIVKDLDGISEDYFVPGLFRVYGKYDEVKKEAEYLGNMDIHGTKYWEE
ncbi:MAG: WG repeat-containing protein [Bacteroidetes bacterium]|nr:WG repeat-containing protein [Bacteroidota bacterium]